MNKRGLLAGVAVFAVGSWAMGAQAAAAQEAASPGAQLEEVVVTATKRTENLQTVPISVSAFTARQLVSAGLAGTMDLKVLTPSLNATQQSGGFTPFLRGVGSADTTPGQEASVTTYVDGVYMASPYSTLLSFNNVDRVEVLKGPQGTLFGRNATGGLIQVITRDPSSTPSARASLSYGNFKTVEAQAYATTGIAADLASDLALYVRDQGEGYGRNVTTGREANDSDEVSVRSKWLYAPSEDTQLTAIADWSWAKSSTGIGRQFYPGSLGVDGRTTYTGRYYDITGNVDPHAKRQGGGASLKMRHDMEGLRFTSLTSYRRMQVDQYFDNDGTALPLVNVAIVGQRYRTFTQELQLQSDTDGPLKWTLGAYYLRDRSGFLGPLGLGLTGSAFGANGQSIHNVITTNSIAAYGEGVLALGSRTRLTVGARWTQDRRKIDGYTNAINGSTLAVLSTLSRSAQAKRYREPTWRVILDHQLTPSVFAYASVSRGFKSGGFNPVAAADAPFNPERLTAYEGGIKTEAFDRRLRLNAAAFHYVYADIQLPITLGPTTTITNAADSSIDGAEVEGQAVLGGGLSLQFGLYYLDSKIKDFTTAPCYVARPTGGAALTRCDVSGRKLPQSPKWTANLGGAYTVTTDAGAWAATVNLYRNDGFFWDPENRVAQKAYSLVNATLGWTSVNGAVGVQLFGRNLNGAKYVAFGNISTFGDRFAAAAPRTYGVRLTVER